MQFNNQPNQATLAEIEQTLDFIRQHAPQLEEKWGDSKWTDGNKLFCSEQDGVSMYTYMVGALKSGKVTWHIMPFYAVTELKSKWQEALSPFISGKSCIQFKYFSELPLSALKDIVINGSGQFEQVMIAHNAKRKRK